MEIKIWSKVRKSTWETKYTKQSINELKFEIPRRGFIKWYLRQVYCLYQCKIRKLQIVPPQMVEQNLRQIPERYL